MAVSELHAFDGNRSHKKRRGGASSRRSNGMDIEHRFNALRFLAMNLKSSNDSMTKPRTANRAGTPKSSNANVGQLGGATF